MRTPQFLIFRGSTPTLELALPLVPAETDVIYLTLSQMDAPVLELARNGVAAPAGTGSLSLSPEEPGLLLASLTQQDTLRLKAGACRLQLRIRTGEGADTFFPVTGYVGEAQKEGEI